MIENEQRQMSEWESERERERLRRERWLEDDRKEDEESEWTFYLD